MEVIFGHSSTLKNALLRDNNTVEDTTCSIKPLTTRATYSAFLSKMATSPTCKFKHGFTKENILNVYLLPFTTTKDIANNDTCPLCNAEKQTSNHMLYSCPKTIGVRARSDLGGAAPRLPEKITQCPIA